VIAKTSQTSGDLKFGQISRQFGYGISQKNFQGREEPRGHDREDRHRLGGAVDRRAEAGPEQVQDRRDQRSRVADTDPEHERDDVDAPHHRRVVAGDAESLVDLVGPAEDAEPEAGQRDQEPAEPGLRRLEDPQDLPVDLLVVLDRRELDVRRRDVRAARLVGSGMREGGHWSPRPLTPWPTPRAPDG
jgi:hypothetical protein